MLCTPLNLDLLLHFYCTTTPPQNSNAEAVIEGIHYLKESWLIEPTGHGASYTVTDKGRALIEHLLQVPFPVQHWIVLGPEGNS